ncbi:MAG: glutamate--tRNA ligase [Ignavibacteriales bacterium]|nr:glutamate--tRNA ligase [Ignavibacteriales bacterium]
MSVRVRFAPSPTGYLHVGGLRTALYNFLFAKKNNGTFILRIEDTDQSRKVEGATENLIATLQWAGIEFDEGPGKDGHHGPYIQSQRLTLYTEYAEQLVAGGKAYYCFCTSERLEEVRKQQSAQGIDPKYDGHCRAIPIDEAKKRVNDGESYVVRMRVPDQGEVKFSDMIRGEVTIQNKSLDDQVLMKSDGFPTYHLAVVVDDHLMEISHVVRGEEWLPSTPKHVLLYQYFGWELPKFAHLPLLLNPDKSKLSKRQGDVAVEDYRAKGYLKEALVNFVAFLGWNPGDEREIFSLDDLINEFSFERVGKSGAVFNIEKLNWMNQQHIKVRTNEDLLPLVKPLVQEKGWTVSDEYLLHVIGLMKERVVVMNDFISACSYFYEDPSAYDETARAKNWKPESSGHVSILCEKLETLTSFDAPSIESALRSVSEELKIGAGKLIHPLRLALSGVSNGPSLFHMAEVLGKETVARRIKLALERLQ